MKNIFSQLKNPIVSRILIFVLLFGLSFGAFLYFSKAKNKIGIENSLIVAPITVLTSSVPGKLKTVYVSEGQMVNKGDVVATIGTEDIRAYMDGMVVDTNKQIGTYISPQISVVKIINPNDMRVDGTLDENKGLNDIKVGQSVSFTVDALPGKVFWGYVDEVAMTAKQTQLSFSISSERPTQQFDVFAHFDATKYPEIKNGMSAKMTVFTQMP